MLHLTCDVHKLSTSIGWSQSCCQEDITGLLNSALVTGDLGGLHKLRSLLTQLLFRELRVVQALPPADAFTSQYREDVFQLFLPVQGVPDALKKQNAKRRFILSTFLNGQLQHQSPVHYCSGFCCKDKDDTLCNAAIFISWSLLPCKCPALNRKNWLGSLPNLDWIGLLESHHSLYSRLLVLFIGSPKAVTVSAPAVPPEQSGEAEGSSHAAWDEAVQDALQAPAAMSSGGEAVDDVGDGDGRAAANPPQEEGEAATETAWAEENRRRRLSVREWLQKGPYGNLPILREVLTPLHHYMTIMLAVSGGGWELKQAALAASGKGREYVVVKVAQQEAEQDCIQSLVNIIGQNAKGFRSPDVPCEKRALKFQMAAAGACAVHVFLRLAHSKMPFSLFLLLWDENEVSDILATPPCLRDELSTWFLQKYNTRAALLSAECLALLQAMASEISVDIADIESAHSTTREMASLRSRGWSSSLEALSSRFVLGQFRKDRGRTHSKSGDRKQLFAASVKSEKPKKKTQRRGRTLACILLAGDERRENDCGEHPNGQTKIQ